MAASIRRRGLEPRDLARIAVFAAIIVLLGVPGAIPLPGLVPITLQSLGVMLAGAVLGPLRGSLSVLVVLLLVAAGLPLLSGGRGGLGVFFGPTAGYLIGWIAAAAVVGWIVYASPRVTWPRVLLASIVGGIVVLYAFGIPGTAIALGGEFWPTLVSAAAFLPGDLVKAVFAAVIVPMLWRVYPTAFGQLGRTQRHGAISTASPT